ncbi:hypothetical protein [Myxococcus virescens]|uniref:hypothetical protein n=1 Tax=Myxococcus virescens TaxID=83456 RepID=UPI001649BD51|nr:hypothetical protein [Myxococcus virescens]
MAEHGLDAQVVLLTDLGDLRRVGSGQGLWELLGVEVGAVHRIARLLPPRLRQGGRVDGIEAQCVDELKNLLSRPRVICSWDEQPDEAFLGSLIIPPRAPAPV